LRREPHRGRGRRARGRARRLPRLPPRRRPRHARHHGRRPRDAAPLRPGLGLPDGYDPIAGGGVGSMPVPMPGAGGGTGAGPGGGVGGGGGVSPIAGGCSPIAGGGGGLPPPPGSGTSYVSAIARITPLWSFWEDQAGVAGFAASHMRSTPSSPPPTTHA